MRASDRKKAKARKAAPGAPHRMVQMAIPPKESTYAVSPFTAKVIALPINDGAALVFSRRNETIAQIAGKVGAAIKAAQRREPDKQFIKRRIEHNGQETFAIWRIR